MTLDEIKKECYLLRSSGSCGCRIHTDRKRGGQNRQRKFLSLNFSHLAIKYEFYFIRPFKNKPIHFPLPLPQSRLFLHSMTTTLVFWICFTVSTLWEKSIKMKYYLHSALDTLQSSSQITSKWLLKICKSDITTLLLRASKPWGVSCGCKSRDQKPLTRGAENCFSILVHFHFIMFTVFHPHWPCLHLFQS